MLRQKTISILTNIHEHPGLLERKLPEMVAFLQKQGDADSQGTGNKVTDQEACFADIATKEGFTFLPKDIEPKLKGLYYQYQLKGSQQSLDFALCEFKSGGKLERKYILDCKHTNTKTFFLNDGWFEKDVIYLVNWNQGTKGKPNLKLYIALGQEIPSEEEKDSMKKLQELKIDINKNTENVGSFRPYVRFANQYKCDRFKEKDMEHFANVLAFI
jgi:hypothetical protein